MGPKLKNNWRKKKESHSPLESSLWMSIPWTLINLCLRPPNCGTPLSGSKLRNTISRKGKRGKTTISKSSRRDKTTTEAKGYEEGSRSRGPYWQVPTKDSHVFQI